MAIRTARTTALAVSLPLLIFYKVFWPFIWLLNHSSNLLHRVCGLQRRIALEFQQVRQRLAYRQIVIDDQYASFVRHFSDRGRAA